jgi:hypothetical protein
MTDSADPEKPDKGRNHQKKIFHQSNEILVDSSVLNIIDQLSHFFSEGLHLSLLRCSIRRLIASGNWTAELHNNTPRLTQECIFSDCPPDFDKNRNRLFGARSPFAR